MLRAMAKSSKEEAWQRWHAAELVYRAALEDLADEGPGVKLTKDAAVALAKSRAKADRRMDEYFHRVLGDGSPLSE